MNIKELTVFTAVAMFGLASVDSRATAAIVIDSTQQFSLADGNGLKAVSGLGTFDAGPASKLVVVVSTEHGFNNGAGDITTVKYNGLDLLPVVEEKTGRGTAEIWYLDNPGQIGLGTIETQGANPNGGIGAAYALSGTELGFGAIAAAHGTTATPAPSITTTAADSLVIAVHDNAGIPNSAGTPTADAPLTQVSSGGWGGQWGGHASGYQYVPTISTITPTFTTNTGSTYDLHTVAAEFLLGDPPPILTLQVDTGTGATTLLGDALNDVDINSYEITSPGNSLDATNWSSLADQGFEGDYDGNGTIDGADFLQFQIDGGTPAQLAEWEAHYGNRGPGSGWEESGGVSTHVLAESFLLGNSTIATNASIGLGNGYNESVNAQDLTFRYRNSFGTIIEGNIEYVTSPFDPGDFDEDGDVDGADFLAWQRTDGTPTGLTNWQSNYGNGTQAASGSAHAVPEPTSLVLLVCGVVGLRLRR